VLILRVFSPTDTGLDADVKQRFHNKPLRRGQEKLEEGKLQVGLDKARGDKVWLNH
jgi:hypothetical protein